MDIIRLPDVVLVEVFSKLTLTDRLNLGLCCRRLYDIFNHPSLWSCLTANLVGNLEQELEKQFEFVENFLQTFGQCVHHLRIKYMATSKMRQRIKRFFSKVHEKCKLYSLELEVTHETKPGIVELKPLLQLLENCDCLSSLAIRAWPVEAGDELVSVLYSHPSLPRLRFFLLFTHPPDKATWSSLAVPLLPITQVGLLLKPMANLSVLSLRSTLINDEIMTILARHSRLSHISLMLIHVSTQTNCHVKPVSSQVWQMLRKHLPSISVAISLMNRIPTSNLLSFLLPQIPLVEINFMRFSYCDSEVVEALGAYYASSLQRFSDYTDSEQLGDSYCFMVERCCHLVHFSTYGYLSPPCILQLARLRGRLWKTLEVLESHIKTREVLALDSDIVVGQRSSGEYFLRYVEEHGEEPENERQGKMTDLAAEMCSTMHYKWQPLPRMKENHYPVFKILSPNIWNGPSGRYWPVDEIR